MPKRPIRKWIFRILSLIAILAICAAAGIAFFFARCSENNPRFARLPTPAITAPPIKDYARPPEDTYFTYPEWYIVWSYQEKADFQKEHLPASFPFFGSIAQYWQAYCTANSLSVSGHYPFDMGDHLMLMVIGSSFSLEYALKGAYESTIGRLSEWSSGGEAVEEDRFAAHIAKDYADFVHIRPFYEYSFTPALRDLWTRTPLWGAHFFRKAERRAILSLDYAIEAFYCEALTVLTHAAYGVEPADTYATLNNVTPAVLAQNPHIRIVQQLNPTRAIVMIPRYQEFTETAARLAQSGATFFDIAGNGEVLITAIVPADFEPAIPNSQLLFSTAILTNNALKRIAVRCTVDHLSDVLSAAPKNWQLEHVYDY